mgnify:CR=1 FL=1
MLFLLQFHPDFPDDADKSAGDISPLFGPIEAVWHQRISADRPLGLRWVDPSLALAPPEPKQDLPSLQSEVSPSTAISGPLPSSVARTLHSIRLSGLTYSSLTSDQLIAILHLSPDLVPDTTAIWKWDSEGGVRKAHIAYQSRRRRNEALEVLREEKVEAVKEIDEDEERIKWEWKDLRSEVRAEAWGRIEGASGMDVDEEERGRTKGASKGVSSDGRDRSRRADASSLRTHEDEPQARQDRSQDEERRSRHDRKDEERRSRHSRSTHRSS